MRAFMLIATIMVAAAVWATLVFPDRTDEAINAVAEPFGWTDSAFDVPVSSEPREAPATSEAQQSEEAGEELERTQRGHSILNPPIDQRAPDFMPLQRLGTVGETPFAELIRYPGEGPPNIWADARPLDLSRDHGRWQLLVFIPGVNSRGVEDYLRPIWRAAYDNHIHVTAIQMEPSSLELIPTHWDRCSNCWDRLAYGATKPGEDGLFHIPQQKWLAKHIFGDRDWEWSYTNRPLLPVVAMLDPSGRVISIDSPVGSQAALQDSRNVIWFMAQAMYEYGSEF